MAAETLGLAERRELLALTQVADSLRRGLSAARFLHTFVRDTGGRQIPLRGIANN